MIRWTSGGCKHKYNGIIAVGNKLPALTLLSEYISL